MKTNNNNKKRKEKKNYMFCVIQPAHRGEFNEIGRVYVQALYSTVLEWTISISSW